ncbi:MAG: DUF393 domain-containing protein [Kiritimatiellae bacterium]|nr:DUF393 domain-containing protein [Kiritimatiellia bacterium]
MSKEEKYRLNKLNSFSPRLWYVACVEPVSVILFDGECNLCSAVVRFVLRWEREPFCRFASLQSELGKQLVRDAGGNAERLDTFHFIRNGQLLGRSEAALAVANYLRWPWRAVRILGVLPRRWRDWLYDFIAKNRFRWFGRHGYCAIPDGVPVNRFYR